MATKNHIFSKVDSRQSRIKQENLITKIKSKIEEIQSQIDQVLERDDAREIIKIKFLNTQLMTLVQKLEKAEKNA